ncbi:arginine decarboxylase, pyruvoyl-dependent [Candidatus Woesearchaeota archaeon]|nr:arginine decarboxylase, pyruvoyl-dependent [Candidatus Woesearchaeota archaeon]
MIPKKVFLTKGVGKHKERLISFELALRDAGIETCNIVTVSSIFPPNAKLISKKKGLKLLKPGQVTFMVMSRNESNKMKKLLAASIGIAIPKDKKRFGYLSEHHSFGWTQKKAGDYAEDLAAKMLAAKLGIKLDLDKAWDEQKQYYKVQEKIVTSTNITQTSIVTKKGEWTTVVAAAVLLP